MDSQISIVNMVEEKGDICDIKYKNYALPIGLILEKNNPINHNYEEEYINNIDDILFDNLLKNEKRKRLKNKTKKNKPLKISLTLKKKI